MKTQTSNVYILCLLICLFAAPGVTAYLFYQHPTWLGAARTNKGILLENPVQLSSVEGTKWRIIFWSPATCTQECLGQLDMLARVRLALGRKLYLVDQILVLGQENSVPEAVVSDEIKAKDFRVNLLSATDKQRMEKISTMPQIFIMNPDNYMVLSYQVGTKPGDVYKDLKLLLTTSEIKKG